MVSSWFHHDCLHQMMLRSNGHWEPEWSQFLSWRVSWDFHWFHCTLELRIYYQCQMGRGVSPDFVERKIFFSSAGAMWRLGGKRQVLMVGHWPKSPCRCTSYARSVGVEKIILTCCCHWGISLSAPAASFANAAEQSGLQMTALLRPMCQFLGICHTCEHWCWSQSSDTAVLQKRTNL